MNHAFLQPTICIILPWNTSSRLKESGQGIDGREMALCGSNISRRNPTSSSLLCSQYIPVQNKTGRWMPRQCEASLPRYGDAGQLPHLLCDLSGG